MRGPGYPHSEVENWEWMGQGSTPVDLGAGGWGEHMSGCGKDGGLIGINKRAWKTRIHRSDPAIGIRALNYCNCCCPPELLSEVS